MPDQDQPIPIESRPEDPARIQKRWQAAGRLPCTASVELPAPGITIGDLLNLDRGSIIRSHHAQSGPVPLRVNGVTVARGDLEVSGDRLAVRIAELTEGKL